MKDSNENQSSQSYITGKLKTLIHLLITFCIQSCLQNASSGDLFFLPNVSSDSSQSVSLFYDQSNLSNAESKVIEKEFVFEQFEIPDWTRPHLKIVDQKNCLFSHQDLYFNSEKGLAFQICAPEFNEELEKLKSVLLSFNTVANSRPVYLSSGFEVFYIKYNKLLKTISQIQYSIDGAHRYKNSLSSKNINSNNHAAYLKDLNPSLFPNETIGLFRVFALSGFDLILTEKQALIIYHQPDIRDEVLAIKIKKPNEVQQIKSSLEILFTKLKKLDSESNYIGQAKLIEYYSGNKDNAWIGLQSGEEPGLYDISIQTASGFSYSNRIFMFANSVILFSKDGIENFRSSGSFVAQNKSWSKDGQLPFRSRRLDYNQQSFLSSYNCRHNYLQVCGLAGFPLVKPNYNKTNNAEDYCKVDDLELTEVNFAGIKTQEQIEADGKFIEFKIKRKCKINSLVLLAGNSRIPAGEGEINENDYLIFTAKPEFFANTSNKRLINHYSLRYLSEDSSIFIHDLVRLSNKDFRLPDVATGIVQTWGSSGILHSIDTSSQTEKLNTGTSCGIRPDLIPYNRMNPACNSDNATNWYEPRLTEILLAGARKNDGLSLPKEEFLEFYSQTQLQNLLFSHISISIYNNKNELIKKILIPPLYSAGDFSIISRDSKFCIKDENLHARYNKLNLPNSGTTIELHNGEELRQRIYISKDQATSFNQNIRKSFHRIQNENLNAPEVWTISSDSGIFTECSLNTWSSPFVIASYNAFVRMQERSGQSTWDIFTQKPLQLRFDYFNANSSLYKTQNLNISQKKQVEPRASLGSNRNLVLGFQDNQLFFASELQETLPRLLFKTILAVPKSGDVEWIRICSANGFSLATNETLHIQDSGYSDKIVPANSRIDVDKLTNELRALNQSTLQILNNGCAILIDPDYNGQAIPIRPLDQALWTIEKTSAIGNGISSGEGLLLYSKASLSQTTNISSFGLIDAPIETRFEIPVQTNECLERKFETFLDQKENYEVTTCEN